jgi:lysophospholipase L1-like esterase
MPSRKALTAYTKARTHTVAAMGDSLTFNDVYYGVAPHLMWPEKLAVSLRGLSCNVQARNFGASGDTTTQMLARIAQLTFYDIPAIAVIWGGINDPGTAIAGATTQANISAMITALKAAGVARLVVCNTQYLNWSSGGDTIGTPYATYATLRPFQAAAVTAAADSNVVLCDTYMSLRGLIVAGTETQGSNSWHAVANNQHLNALGQTYIASALLATIQAQPGWLAALQA